MDELENDSKKSKINDTSSKRLAIEAGVGEDEVDDEDENDDEEWDEDGEDFEESIDASSNKQRAGKKRFIAQMGGSSGDGYEEGEADYEEWLKKNNVVDVEDDSLPLASDADVSTFSAEDRDFLARRKQYDEDGNEVTETDEVIGSDGQSRKFITADGLADLMKDIGFDEEANNLEERKARRVHIRADSNKKIVNAAMKSAHGSLENLENKESKAEKYRRVPFGVSAPSSSFEDPFQNSFSSKESETSDGIELLGRRKNIINLLDNEEDAIGDEFDRKIRAPGSNSSIYDNYGEKKRQSYDENDILQYDLKKENIKLFSDFTPEEIAHEWDMVEFGRCVFQ